MMKIDTKQTFQKKRMKNNHIKILSIIKSLNYQNVIYSQ